MQYLVDKAKSVMDNAYAPYSNFKVACALEMNDGTVFCGVNVENASFGGTICAERNAITTAITHGYKKGDFKQIAIIATSEVFVRPCHICRQTFVEFFDGDMKVAMAKETGEYEVRTVSELTPFSFTEIV